MQITKVQSNPTTFGTKVKFEPRAVQIVQQSEIGRAVLKQAKTLEQNGINDILYVSTRYTGVELPQIMTTVLKQQDGKTMISNHSMHRSVTKDFDLIEQYEKMKNNMHEVGDEKNSIKNFLSFLI